MVAGIGAGVLAEPFLDRRPAPLEHYSDTVITNADSIMAQAKGATVEVRITDTIPDHQESIAAPTEGELQTAFSGRPKAVTAKPVEKLSKQALEEAFNSGNGDNVRKYIKQFANFSKCPVYCGSERKTLSQVVLEVSNSYPPLKASVTRIDYDSLGRVKSVSVSLNPNQ